MKRVTITLWIGIFFFTACAGTAPLPPTATVSVSNSVTSTLSPTATATQTPFPSSTPTASLTPIPTITTTAHPLSISTNNISLLKQVAKINGFKADPGFSAVSEIIPSQDFNQDVNNFLITVGYASGDTRLFDFKTLKSVHQFKGESAVVGITVSPDKKTIATTNGSTIHIWDISTEKLIKELDFGDVMETVAFNGNGNMLIAQGDGSTKVWETQTWKSVNVGSGWFLSLYPPDHTPLVLVYPGDGNVIFQNALTNKEIFNLPPAPPEMMPEYYMDAQTASIAYSSDGKLFADGTNYGWIAIWNLEKQNIENVLIGHKSFSADGPPSGIYDLAFAPYRYLLASTGIDGTIRLWDAKAGKSLRVIIMGHSMAKLAFSPDGRYLLAGDFDGNIYIFAISK